jgi:hypothetical protein
MDLDDVWKVPANAPSAEEREAFVSHALAQLRRQRRRRIARLAWTGTTLAAVTAAAAYQWVAQPSGVSWALSLLLAAQWGVFLYWLWPRRRVGAVPAVAGAPIRESLERLFRDADKDRKGQMAVLALFAVATPLMALALLHLIRVGKMAPREAVSAAILAALVLALGAGAALARLRWRILPRHRRLAELLRQYDEVRSEEPTGDGVL